MARKTLSEKRVSDTHHLYHFEKVVAPQLKRIETDTYGLKTSDLTKTILITTVILVSQAILYFILRNQLIRIPGISY